MLQTITDNTKASTDRSSSLYDFTGKVIKTLSTHRVGAGTLQHVVARRMDYDHAGRLLRAYHKLDAQTEVLQVSNEYNELGQLVDKKLHSTDGTNFKQSVDHRYNIRGWLTSINNSALANDGVTNDETTDLYGMELAYNQIFTGVTTALDAQYNGNISAIKWSANLGIANEKERAYKFAYDGMNRLTGATYNARTAGAWAANGAFDENNFVYDLNGNIKSLTRKSFDFDVTHAAFTMDNLTYDYGTGPATSNKLLKVSDAGDKTKGFVEPASTTGNDYIYDANGNMVSDQNKGITAITYNHLNLPVQVNKGASDYIVYTYDAGGRKLSQQVFGSTPKVTDYMGEFIYEGNVLQFVNTEEGRIVMTGANPEYQYHLKDHLGNVRTTFTTVTTPEVNTATYETANLTAEMGKFLRMDKARRANSTLFDRTNGSSPGFSERLNGTTNEKYGLARSIAVSSGDVVSAEVYAKYPDTNTANWLPALSTLMGNIASNTGNIVVDGSNYANGNNPFNALFAQAHTPSGTAPQAYLNWMVFDKNWNLISSKSGYMQITTAGRETGSDVAHERLFTPSISITEPGYVYIYVSNEDLAAPKDVFFDDFSVTQVKTPIVQVEDYYPFGLTFNSYQRDSSMPDQYLYNGKELQDELSLGWLDYGARMYMPELGRWGVADPYASKYAAVTAYNYAFNSPVLIVDPDGREGTIYIQVLTGKNGLSNKKNKELFDLAKKAAEGLNALYRKNGIALSAVASFGDKILSKKDFFDNSKRSDASSKDSYMLVMEKSRMASASKEIESKGWAPLDLDEGATGIASKGDPIAIINGDDLGNNTWVHPVTRNLIQEDYASKDKKLMNLVMHEDGHGKFRGYPGLVGSHIPNTIMDRSPLSNSKYDDEMLWILKKFHGTPPQPLWKDR